MKIYTCGLLYYLAEIGLYTYLFKINRILHFEDRHIWMINMYDNALWSSTVVFESNSLKIYIRWECTFTLFAYKNRSFWKINTTSLILKISIPDLKDALVHVVPAISHHIKFPISNIHFKTYDVTQTKKDKQKQTNEQINKQIYIHTE